MDRRAVTVASAAGCRRKGPPVARRVREGRSPKGGAQDARQFAVSTRMCCQRTSAARSRTRRAGCPEGATPGVCFLLVTFLCTSKEELPARPKGEWKLCTSKHKSKELD